MSGLYFTDTEHCALRTINMVCLKCGVVCQMSVYIEMKNMFIHCTEVH